jgi:hypothetical protein
MRRYLITAVVAELFGIVLLYVGWTLGPSSIFGEERDMRDFGFMYEFCLYNRTWRFDQNNVQDQLIARCAELEGRLNAIAFSLVCVNNLPILICLPVAGVFAQWTLDRRRERRVHENSVVVLEI